MAGIHHNRVSFGDPGAENFQRLRQYDAAVASDSKQANFDERMDFQRQKEAFDEAHKTSEAERKASEFESRSNLRGDQVNLLQERLKLQQEVANHTQLLKEEAQIAKDRATLARQKAGMEFYKGIGELDPQSHDFRVKYGQLMQKVGSQLVDSEGKVPEDVQKAGDHLWAQHNTWAATNQRQAQKDPLHESLQDALAASKPTYGTMENGKFKSTEAGKEVQDFVQATYADPKSGMAVTHVFPRTGFDSSVAAAQVRSAASQSAPQVTAPATATTAVTTAPTPAVAAPSAATAQPAAPLAVAAQGGQPQSGDEYTDPVQVRNDYRAGRLNKDQAADILRNKFDHQ